MYNGIGLDTARGSGTNGYVQRNLSFIRRHKDNVDYKSEEELKKLDAQLNKGPSADILEHERKRKVELKCMEMQELMEEQGYSTEEIDHKVSIYREMLMEKVKTTTETTVEKDEAGRPIAKATHQIAEANQARNEQLKQAFGLSEYYKDGSSLDPQRKAKEQAAEALAMAQKTYAMVPEEDSDSSSSASQSPSPEKKKNHKKAKTESQKASTDKKKRKSSSESPPAERKRIKPRSSPPSSPSANRQRTANRLSPSSHAMHPQLDSPSPEGSPPETKSRRHHRHHHAEADMPRKQRRRSHSPSREKVHRKYYDSDKQAKEDRARKRERSHSPSHSRRRPSRSQSPQIARKHKRRS